MEAHFGEKRKIGIKHATTFLGVKHVILVNNGLDMKVMIFLTGFLALFYTPFSASSHHPIFLSVTNLQHNKQEGKLEMFCKIFTNDFELVLKQKNKEADLLNPKKKNASNLIINSYIQSHLSISVDGRKMDFNFIGFEQEEDALLIFYQVDCNVVPKQIIFENSLLYDYKKGQMNIMHVEVNGIRKSSKLNNPETKAIFQF